MVQFSPSLPILSLPILFTKDAVTGIRKLALDGEHGMPDESEYYAARRTVSIEIPDDLAEALAPDGDLPHRARETLAVNGYRHELLSQVQVGNLLGLSRVQTEDFLAKHVDLIDYDASELQRESEALKKISQRSPRS